MIKTRVESKTYLCCVACDGDVGTIDHLVNYEKLTTSWYCDKCGVRNTFNVTDGVITSQALDNPPQYHLPSLILVEAVDCTPPLRFLVQDTLSHPDPSGKATFKDIDSAHYWVGTHTCPTNWLGVKMVISGTDTDPHERFRALAVWGPGDCELLDIYGFEPEPTELEAKIGGEDIFQIDEKDILISSWLELQSHTDELEGKFKGGEPAVDLVSAAREWIDLYGKNPRAWWYLGKAFEEETDLVIIVFEDTYTYRGYGRNFTYNTTMDIMSLT